MTDRITITDLRHAGYCAGGIRSWFEGQGLDFRDFLHNGIEAETLRATGDGHALALLKRLEKHDG